MATSDLCDALRKHAIASGRNVSRTRNTEDHDMNQDPSSATSNSQTQMIDFASEKKICDAVLRLVDDSSNDVQAIAVKTLGVLVTCVHEDMVVAIAERLASLVLDKDNGALRDVYTIGLRTLVQTVPMNMGDIVSSRLAAGLLDGIRKYSPDILSKASLYEATSKNKDKAKAIREDSLVAEQITLACLEILTELLARFGALSFITQQHLTLLEVTLRQLACESELVRKRAGTTIGNLSIVISDQLLGRLVESLLMQIDRSEAVGKSGRRKSRRIMANDADNKDLIDCKSKDTCALIRTMCTVAGQVGHRLGQEQIDRLVPIFSRFCDPADAAAGDDMYDDDDDEGSDEMEDSDEEDEEAIALANELREACLLGYESFVLSKPVEIQPYLPVIIHTALAYMRHDPNYSYGDENNAEGDDNDDAGSEEDYDMDDDEEEEEYDEDEYDDDQEDDESWNVRRSAIRTLNAIVKIAAHDPSKLWTEEYAWRKNKKYKTTVAAALVNRFKERDENCRVEIVHCFSTLLGNTIEAAKTGDIILKSDDTMDVTGDAAHTVIDLRTKYAPLVVKGCEAQLKEKKAGNRTKVAALSLISTLCKAPGGIGNEEEIKILLRHVRDIISSSDTSAASVKSLKLDSLQCIHTVITSPNHKPDSMKDCIIEDILPELCKTLQENWYKITAESLQILTEIPSLVVNANASAEEKGSVTKTLYEAIEPRLALHDSDQEVKETSLQAAAALFSNLHEYLDVTSRERLLSLILVRLKHDNTRVFAIRTISKIIKANVDTSSVINDIITELGCLCRQSSRSLLQNTLQCLDTIVTLSPSGVNAGVHGNVLKEISNCIVDSDLHVSHLALKVCSTIFTTVTLSDSEVSDIRSFLLPSLLNLSKSSLLQDKALDSLLVVMEELITSNVVNFEDLLKALKDGLPVLNEGQVNSPSGKLSIANISKCIAAITAVVSDDDRKSVVEDLISSLESLKDNQTTENCPFIQLALRVSGDLGSRVHLGLLPGVTDRLHSIFISLFDSSFEDIKHAAAYGLGRASVFSKEEFLPKILAALEGNGQNKQYLLLTGLKEMIYCHQKGYGGNIGPSIAQILPHLNRHLADEEEGIRTMVADCMGCLACLEPNVILPHLQSLVVAKMNGEDPITCATVLGSVKYAIANKCQTEHVLPYIPTFLQLLKEEDLSVKNACLLMIYSAVHHNSDLVLGFMKETIVPALHGLAVLKEERVIDLGPFKQKVDDALPIRKAALSIFSTCLDKCPQAIEINEFIPILASGLGDKEDVQLQSHQIIVAMSSKYPSEIAAAVETFVAPLEKTMNKKMGNKKGAELDRAKDWVKSAIRVMVVLSKVTDAMK